MTYINLTNITNANTTLELVQAVNINLGGNGMFILLSIIAFFIILFMSFDAGSAKETFLITSFITSIMTSLFWLAGLVPMYLAVVTWILVFIGVVLSFLLD